MLANNVFVTKTIILEISTTLLCYHYNDWCLILVQYFQYNDANIFLIMTNVFTTISTTLLCRHYSDECLIFVQCYSRMNDVMSLTYN